jgi:hypothetical protein
MQQHALRSARIPTRRFFAGDFYEMFGDDAVVASRLLDLTLTSRNRGKPDEVPMAGVPHHAAHGYVARLLELGHTVAICEQMADPAKTKGILPREVVRVITPGLVTDGAQLEARANNWLCASAVGACGGIALFDLSTSELVAAEVGDPRHCSPRSAAGAARVLLGSDDAAKSPLGASDLAAAAAQSGLRSARSRCARMRRSASRSSCPRGSSRWKAAARASVRVAPSPARCASPRGIIRPRAASAPDRPIPPAR